MKRESEVVHSSEAWSDRFRVIVSKDNRARKSRDTLAKLGIDIDEISGFLSLSCEFEDNPAFTALEKVRKSSLRQTTQALRAAKRLEDDEIMLREFSSVLPEFTLETINKAATILRSEAIELRTLFSKHKLNTSFFVSWLISSIEEKTGNPHYREVSFLLECAYLAYGKGDQFVGEEALRKMHRRFMKSNPFNEFMSTEGKSRLLMAGVIILLVKYAEGFLTSGRKIVSLQPREPIDIESILKSLPFKSD